MTRSRVNSSETHDETQKSILKNNKDVVAIGMIEPNARGEKMKENEDQATMHAFEQNRKPEHYPHPHHGTVAMIERKTMKSHLPPPVMPTPTSTERKFTNSFYWISHLHKNIGLSHIILILVLAAYSALGAVVFYYLEKPNERKVVAERRIMLDNRIEQLAEYLSIVADNKTTEEMEIDVKTAYVEMLNVEGSYRWSTFYRSDDPENNYKWTFSSSFFFAMNVYTTTGYGSISPETRAGQWFVMIYGFIFVPVTLVVIRDLGQWLLLAITKLYARILLKYRRCCGKKSDKPNEVIHLPIVISVLIMIGFIGFMTMFVYYLDAFSGPPGTGLNWFHSFYFTYMSFTTIGLGDVMPNNATFAPIVSILFFLGLPIMKVVNRMTYITIENGTFGMLTVIENRFDNYLKGKQPAITEVETGTSEENTTASEDSYEIPAEWVNNVTINSIATFMKSNRDVYGGSFGKVHLRTADVLPSNEQDTVMSRRSHR